MTSLLSDKITDVRATRHSHQQVNSENSRGYDTVKATMETDPHRSSNSPSCGEHSSSRQTTTSEKLAARLDNADDFDLGYRETHHTIYVLGRHAMMREGSTYMV